MAYEATKTAFTVQDVGQVFVIYPSARRLQLTIPQAITALDAPYSVIAPVEKAVVVPVLRSGLQMVDSFLELLPSDTATHHLGLFRDKHTLAPVEYYNKLPPPGESGPVDIAFVVDPIIATGGTASTVVAILKEWGVKRIIFTSILASTEGIARAANEWPEG